MSNLTLYQINKDFEECLNKAIDTETGEVLNENLIGVLNSIEMALEEKAINTAYVIKQLGARAKVVDEEIKRLKKLKDIAEKAEESLKQYLHDNIPEGKKIETDLMKISWRKSTAVEITDMSKLPHEYITTKIDEKPDKEAIADAIKSGKEVAGAELVERQNIQIR